MKLSVMFITYNRKDEILRAIKSCLENRIAKMEFVIVDNNSNDGTMAEVKKLLESSNIDYKYYFSDRNLGVSGGRNKAFSICSGEYVFCFDDDAIIKTELFFKKTCDFLDKNKDVAAIAYNIYEPKSGNYLIGQREKGVSIEENPLCLSFVGAAHTLRRELFSDKIYPEKLFFGAEELYASHTIWSKGYKVVYVDDMKVDHLPSSINRTEGKVRDYNFILNQYIVRLLNYPYLLWPILTILFNLRLVKNKLLTPKYIKSIRQDLKIRYNKEERHVLSYRTIAMLVKKFGIKNIF
ncbi:glycosyltransferase family 2 protein [Paraclostridium sordellii]|uniref:glycosyltransferase family 2 protein n=1 Tax=Paraclostridium sordellii TaxID=1505 RepID=UPI0005E9197B|nr:glycosyltransferase family 2 protein [Paeniclostridium sordellii]CEN21615.1 glycosyltransferase [[Clostridium] sordellii] [Paeniclostridium sordellii]